MTKLSYPQNKNRVSTEFKSYDQKIKIVKEYFDSLDPEEKQKFNSGALSLQSFGVPHPKNGSMEMNLLLIQWYDRTVESFDPQIQDARNAEI